MKNIKISALLQNTVMMYIMQVSTYVLNLITVPYQTRVLGPAIYGNVGFAVAIMAYFQIFMDFGFMLSATESISKNILNHEYVNKRYTSVTLLKLMFALISIVVMGILCLTVPKFAADPRLYMFYILGYSVNALMPDFLYRAIEKMTAITVRTVLIRLFFTVMLFVFLKSPDDYVIIPVLSLIGNIGAVVGAYIHIYKKLGYNFTRVHFSDLITDFKRSLIFFTSEIATTVYSATNTVILGFVDKTGVSTGLYTSADKVLSTAKNGFSPIATSLFPHMIKNKDFRLIKKVILITEPVLILGCICVGFLAEPLCVMFFGEEYAGTAPVLVAFLPAIVALLPRYILAYPTLGAMGLTKYANYSVIFGACIHIVGLIVMFFTNTISIVSLACMTSISEWVILVCEIIIVFKNRDILSANK